jgi:glucosamine-6-phosphate deaminase
MNDKLFNHINIDMNNTHLPNGKAADLHAEAARYEKEVAALGYADLQVLGVGLNGHIGFNEPDSVLVQDTHVTDLTEDTIDANSRFFASADEVPKQALTMGIGTIMQAKKIILLASGANKRDAIATLFNGKVDPMSPVTVLNLHHDVTLLCDDAAWPL